MAATPPQNQRKRIVVVLGMHRSGTSVTMNVLNALGVPLSDDLMPATQFNQKGYFESNAIRDLQDDILKCFSMTWSTSTITRPFPPQWWRLPQIAPFRQQLVEIVKAEFEKAGPLWGFKDPRTARLLPMWLEIIAELDLEPSFVLVSRSPRECAQSLYTRERVLPMHSELLWLEHTADAIAHTQGKLDAIIDYKHWFDDPVAQANYLIESLRLEPQPRERVEEIVAGIVAGDLRHHSGGAPGYELPFCAEFYDALLNRNVPQLLGLTNIFQATRQFSTTIVGQATNELLSRFNDATRIANERGQQVVSLEAQVRALQAALQATKV